MKTRLAIISDLDRLNMIQYEAANRIKETGSTQWATILLGEEKANLKKQVEQGHVWVIEENETILGLLYLYDTPNTWDRMLWENQELIPGACYLHKLALSNEAVGKGVADEFLHQTMTYVHNNNQVICLDCMAQKKMLSKLYERVGFEFIASVPVTNDEFDKELFNLYRFP